MSTIISLTFFLYIIYIMDIIMGRQLVMPFWQPANILHSVLIFMLLWQINIIVVVAGITYTVIMTTECELVISLGELGAQNWLLILHSLPTSRGDAQRNNGARPHTVIRALAPPWSLYSHDDPSVFLCVVFCRLQQPPDSCCRRYLWYP